MSITNLVDPGPVKKQRTSILAAILVGLIGLYLVQSQVLPLPSQATKPKQQDGENVLGDILIEQRSDNSYRVHVNYRYGGKFADARLRSYAVLPGGADRAQSLGGGPRVVPGENKMTISLGRNRERNQPKLNAYSTRIVRVEMVNAPDQYIIASKDIVYPIDWPRSHFVWRPDFGSTKEIDELYELAVSEIDYGSENSLSNARAMLDSILTREPDFVPAFPELARYYMKSNWGPEARSQAERILLSALDIDPRHANSQVLIGYVYTHQGRHDEAEAAFKQAAEIGTENLWLWVNWGELRLMQGRVPDAIAMFKKAAQAERPYSTYDRAQKDAYRRLIKIYRLINDVEAANRLHLVRMDVYPTVSCYPHYYAKFRQDHFDDTATVLKYALKALASGCRHREEVRKVLGAAYYTRWYSADDQDAANQLLTQARLYFPEGPRLIHWLARTESMSPVIGKLIENGISIDIKDSNGLTALAYALRDDDLEVIKRLIVLGGNPNITIGEANTPILAVAVMSRQEDNVRYLIEQGANVNGEILEGMSLIEYAESMGYSEIAEMLRLAERSQKI